MATRYPTLGLKALGARGTAMARALTGPGAPTSYRGIAIRKPAPRAPRSSAPRLGGDTVQVAPERPSAAQSVQFAAPSFSGGTGGYDVGSDPAVARISALSAKMRATAQATAAAKRKQAALEYGDPTGVEGLDAATQKAARENPFSILAAMKRAYDTGITDLEEGLNKANLFYSGYRGQQLGEAATAHQQGRYDAGTRFQGTITDINDALAAALMNADMMDAQAAMSSGGGYYDPGGYYDDGYMEEPRLEPQGPYLFGAVDSLLNRAIARPMVARQPVSARITARPPARAPWQTSRPQRRSGV